MLELSVVQANRVAHIRRGHVVVVQHVRLVIPPNPEVEREPRRRAPIVLQICTQRRVVRREERVAGRPLQFEGVFVRVGHVAGAVRIAIDQVAIPEGRELVVAFVHIVGQSIQCDPDLDHVLPTRAEARVCEVIAEPQSFLREVLIGLITTQDGEAVIALRNPRGLGGLRAAEARIRQHRFIEPRARHRRVFEIAEVDILPIVDGLGVGRVPAKVSDVVLVTEAAAPLES